MLPFNFGSPAVALVSVVEPAPAPALESIVSTVEESDHCCANIWLHGKSLHTQRADKRAADHFLAFVFKPLHAVMFGDFQAFTATRYGKSSSRRQSYLR